MGITGLIPFLEKSSKRTNISEFSGGTVAIDTYCWLHKGAFSCADKIIMGQPTDVYVKYCMKFVNMLLGHNIKPILVFDGRHLPAKAETESKRRQSREANRKRAAELVKMGKTYEGKNLLKRSLDVNHAMALEVIKECQARNVDCIVAPYEADAQLAYLSISGIADVIVTEDSDLTLFGCKKIMFKMDLYGHGVLVEQDRLHIAMGLNQSNFHIDKFRYMCILSGCDYLASLPGIGLGKACKFIVKNRDDDIYNALLRMSFTLNMKSLAVTDEYRDGFMRALVTFKHQLVYCPLQRKQVRLSPPTSEVTEEQLIHAGTEVEAQLAWQLALGNCDPFTWKKMHDFDPDLVRSARKNAWSKIVVSKHTSIWSENFKIKEIKEKKSIVTPKKENNLPVLMSCTRGQTIVLKTESLKKQITPRKRTYEEAEAAEAAVDEMIETYGEEKKPSEESGELKESSSKKIMPELCSPIEEKSSPIFIRRSNPFRKTSDADETSPSLLHRVRRRLPIKGRLKVTVIDDTVIPQSKFFSTESAFRSKTDGKEESMDVTESKISNVIREDCKENMNLSFQKIIPETEISEDEMFPEVHNDVNKDSGFKESSYEKDANTSAMSCDDSLTEKQPLHTVDTNSAQNSAEVELNDKLSREENNDCTLSDDEMDFSITSQTFSECKSSLFNHENPIEATRLKNVDTSSKSISNNIQSQDNRFNRRSVKSNTKKKATIRGQQSLLSMFGYKTKNTLKH